MPLGLGLSLERLIYNKMGKPELRPNKFIFQVYEGHVYIHGVR